MREAIFVEKLGNTVHRKPKGVHLADLPPFTLGRRDLERQMRWKELHEVAKDLRSGYEFVRVCVLVEDENTEELIIALLGSLSLRNLASQTSKSSDSNPVTENNFQKSGRMIYVYNTYQWLSQPFY